MMLGILVRWLARTFGSVHLFNDIVERSWYLGWCAEHGYYIDYAHGYDEYIRCPDCWEHNGDDDDGSEDDNGGYDGTDFASTFAEMVDQSRNELREMIRNRSIFFGTSPLGSGLRTRMEPTPMTHRARWVPQMGILGDDALALQMDEIRLFERTLCNRCPSGPYYCEDACFLGDPEWNDKPTR
jgi:hypothetical protein